MVNEIIKLNFKSSAKLQLEVINLHKLAVENKHLLITPHRTNFYHVFLFEDCSPTHMIDFNSVKINPYTLLFIDKDRVHQFDRLLKYEGDVLIFTDNFFCKTKADTQFLGSTILFNNISDKPALHIDKSKFEHFKMICQLIKHELQTPDDSYKHNILKNLLHNFLLIAEREKRKLVPGEVKGNADLDYTILFRELLETYFHKIKSVSTYTGKLHITEKRLNHATSRVLGKTPKEMIDERVMLEAKRMLAHSGQSVKEIGFELGFNEPTNFIKYFKKHSGLTPVEFREQFITA